MNKEILLSESDFEAASRLLHQKMSYQQWQSDFRCDESYSGYIQYSRTYTEGSNKQFLEFEEINNIAFLNGHETATSRNAFVSVFSGEENTDGNYDIVTTFGMNLDTGHLIVTQARYPGIQFEIPEEQERLQRYPLYEIAAWDSEKQLHELVSILSV